MDTSHLLSFALVDTVNNYLDRFETLTKEHPGAAPWSFRFDQGKHDKHVLFGGITHGNEVGSLPALIELAEKLLIGDIVFGGTVSIVLGNVKACLEGERFLEADLNRVFLEDAPESAEKVRALEMMPLFDDVDLFIDFHQTIEPSEQPFFIFPYHASGYNWARILEPEIGLVTRDPERAFAQGQVCADEYARGLGIPGITLEMGQKGLTEMAYQLTSQCCRRAIEAMDRISSGETLESIVESDNKNDLRCFEIQYAQKFSSEYMMLDQDLKNFTQVKAGEVIGKMDEEGAPLVVPMDGYLLFPKYPKRSTAGAALTPYPSEIYNLAIPMLENPKIAYSRT